MNVVGLLNIQYAIAGDTVYILEANPRASRTVPIVSKVCGINMAAIATRMMLGKTLADEQLRNMPIPYFGVKEAVFPFNMFPEVDPLLGPEMRSTGEVLGLAESFGLAFFKSQEAANTKLPTSGGVLLTVSPADRPAVNDVAKRFATLGFKIYATEGTHEHLKTLGIESVKVNKVHEGRPNLTDVMKNGDIQLIVNTPAGKHGSTDDSYIRKTAIRLRLPYITTIAAAGAAAKGVEAIKKGDEAVKSLQEYQKR